MHEPSTQAVVQEEHIPTLAEPAVYGLVAEYDDAEELVAATRRAYAEGYRKLDAYSPFPVHGLSEALNLGSFTGVPPITLIAGLIGAASGFGLQAWINLDAYPLNIGGRPFLSWPAFIPVTFECGILVAAFSTAIGMFILNGLPRPHHPVFNASRFHLASRDRFFLSIEAADELFDTETTREFLERTGAVSVEVVETEE